MDSLEAIKNRRSCRKFLEKEVEEEKIIEILECAKSAPFGGKPKPECQVAEFIVIKEEKQKERLALQYEDRKFMIKAPVLIACLADKQRDPNYSEYVISTSLATQNMIIAAEQLGLSSCVLSCFLQYEKHKEDKQELRDILQLPENIELISLVAIGYRHATEEIAKKELRSMQETVSYEVYGKKEKQN